MVKTENIADLTNKVISRHDRYVQADQGTNQVKRSDFIVNSLKLRALIKRKEVKASVLGPFLWPLLQRHDAYIEGDEKLKKVLKRTRLRSSDILRKILIEAGYQGG